MYALTAASAAILNSDHRRVVLYAMVGVIWGWAVAGVAFLPYAILLLLVGNPMVYLPAGVVFLTGTVVPMIGCDRLFYGKWTVSLAFHPLEHAFQHWFALPQLGSAFRRPELALWCCHLVLIAAQYIRLIPNHGMSVCGPGIQRFLHLDA